MSMLPKYVNPVPDGIGGLNKLDSRISSAYAVSSVSTTVVETIEDRGRDLGKPQTALPPKKIKPRHNPNKHYEIAIIASTYMVLSATGFVGVSMTTGSGRRGIDDCHDDATLSATETRFQIDLPVTEPLSFAHAKLIDLVWDLSVGHGGRLLHGWVLYQVATKAIAWMLECSVLSYSVLFSILFQENSFYSLWALGRSLGRRQRARTVLMTVFLIFSIIHILFFGAIWSAATGYQSPGTLAFAMADRSWVTKDTDTLRVCWSIPPNRPELVGIVDGDVVLGPDFGTVFNSFSDLTYSKDWARNRYPHWAGASEDFWNIYSYARSKTITQDFLEGLDITSQPFSPNQSIVRSVQWDEGTLSQDNREPSGVSVPYTGDTGNQLPQSIKGYQFMGVHEESTAEPENTFWRNWTTSPIIILNPEIQEQDDKTVEYTAFSRSIFSLNESIPYAKDSGVVPYNSSFWYRDKRIHIRAPFLDFNSTSGWLSTPLGEGVCYNGKLLTEDFRIESHKACTGGTNYVWGFSSFITRVGLLLECLWCSVCLYIWLYSARHSTLSKYNRPCTGTVRNILDLAEVIKEELGPNTCLYSDKEMKKALADSPLVRFVAWENRDGTGHIGLASESSGGDKPVGKIQLDLRKEYG